LSLGAEENLSNKTGRELAARLVELSKDRGHHACLDVGGGTGALGGMLSASYPLAVVLEPSAKKVAYGSKRGRAQFVRAVAEAMPFADGSFDLVTAVASFHHMTDRGLALAEMHRLLAKGGLLAVVEIDMNTARGRILRFLENRVMRHDVRFPSREELEQLLAGRSLNIVSAEALRRGILVAAEAP